MFSAFKHIFKLSNIGTIIFFLLNAFMIIGIFAASGVESLVNIILLYIISIVVALSPFGEWLLGFVSGARRMTRVDMKNRVQPLLARVHSKALVKTPDMPRKIKLKVMYDPTPNAFALGRRTICVTEGLLNLSDDMIEGILAHEMGHLAHRHTAIQLLIGGGNFVITLFLFAIKIFSWVMTLFGTLFSFSRRGVTRGCGCIFAIVGIICSAMIWLWTRFCMLFLCWSSRANEYVADKYAMELGYGYELAYALDTIGMGTPKNSFMKALYSTHPKTHDRIGRLQSMGVPYSKY